MNEERSSWPDRITVNPDVCNSQPIIRGKRITVQTVLEFLSAGETEEEILRQFPSLELDDIRACQAAAAKLKDEQLRAAAAAAQDLYAPGSELTEWTCLDGEDVIEP